ncbi:MAG: hypothetical protein WC340_10755 [Kiritimatiellia bacterium]
MFVVQWLTNYELACLKWYVRETEAQMEEFKKQFPRIKYYEVEIKDLNSLAKVQKLLDFFGCKGKKSLTEAVGIPRNIKKTKFVPTFV